jgi:phosphoserine aminotransferase
MLYAQIDASNGFYFSKVKKEWRSRVNVIFRIAGGNKDLEELFIQEAEKAKII